jgi:hypothetical protein
MEKLPLKAFGRSLSEFELLFDNYPAERSLLEKCRSGELAIISAQRPEQPTKENTVRSSFLYFLALGGDEYAPVHEKGVRLQGAWVEDNLDLEGAILPHSLVLLHCHLSSISLLESNVHGFINFDGCHINVLQADRITCSGSIFLKNTTGKVILTGAQIGGDLECHGGKFNGNGGHALICERAVIKGNVLLRDSFTATGTVSLSGVKIGGNLECDGGKFNGNGGHALICRGAVIKGNVLLRDSFTAKGSVYLSGAQIGGYLECIGVTLESTKCNDNFALEAQHMVVSGAFFVHELVSVIGTISLYAARVGSLVDDKQSWTEVKLNLDGFIYDRLAGTPDAKTRITWLNRQSKSEAGLDGIGGNFKPQPWQQLQKVLREMGHLEDARQVAIEFEKRLRKANLIGQTPESWCKPRAWLYRKISRRFHWLFGWLIGYGYRPLGLFFKMFIVWLICGVIYWGAAVYGNNGNGVFAPSNPLVFQNTEYATCVPDSCAAKVEKMKSVYSILHEVLPPNTSLMFQNTEYAVCIPDSDAAKAEKTKSVIAVPPPVQGAGNWYLCEKLRPEYTGFSPFAYSLDLILPLVDLQQENDWSPMIPTPDKTSAFWTWTPNHEYFIRLVIWFEILFGWVASLLLVAVVSGLTKRREE